MLGNLLEVWFFELIFQHLLPGLFDFYIHQKNSLRETGKGTAETIWKQPLHSHRFTFTAAAIFGLRSGEYPLFYLRCKNQFSHWREGLCLFL
jgi:hypothetical protein